MTRLELSDLPADRLQGEALLVPLFSDQRPLAGPAAVVDWRLDGAVTQLVRDGVIAGKSGECLGMQTNAKFAAFRVVFLGGGRWQSLDQSRYQTLVSRLVQVADNAGIHELALCLPPCEQVRAEVLEQMVRDALAGSKRLERCRLSLNAGLR